MENETTFSLEIKLTAKDLWQFLLYHSNKGFLGIFNLFFSAAALVLLIARWGQVSMGYRLLLILCVGLFTVWQPCLLYYKARRQAKAPAIKNPMQMLFTKELIQVSQSEQNADFTWEQVGRIEGTPWMFVVYMDRVHAYLIPYQVLGEQKETFAAMIRECLPAERRKRV